MKNKIYSSLLLSSILFLSVTNYSCQISTACTKIGYGQQIHRTFFDKENSIGYFIYSYFTDKNTKQYSLYKIDLNGKFEEITKLQKVNIEQKNYLDSKLDYTYYKLDENNLVLTEQNEIKNVTGKNSISYIINVKNKEILYKVDESNGIKKIFSPDKEKYFYLDGFGKSTSLAFVDMKNKVNNSINVSDNIILPKDSHEYLPTSHKSYWLDNNNILIYSIENELLKELFIYSIKDNNLIKTNQYKFKEKEPQVFDINNYKASSTITSISYENNIFTFYCNLLEKREMKSNKVDYYYNSTPYANVYKLDFSKNDLTLSEEFKLTETLTQRKTFYSDDSSNNDFIVGKDLIYTGGSGYKNLLDYREKLPKGYYDNDLVCSNDLSSSRVNTGNYSR